MNDSELEACLRALRPVAPSSQLDQKVAGELTPVGAHPRTGKIKRPASSGLAVMLPRLFRDFAAACLGATAAFLSLAYLHQVEKPAPAPAPAATLVNTEAAIVQSAVPAPTSTSEVADNAETTNELVASEDTDQLIDTDSGPAREIRYSYRETHAWQDARTGARIVLEVPRDDVYL